MRKMALYEKWKGRKSDVYGRTDMVGPTVSISIFPADADGLEKAIKAAIKPDAVLVKMDREYNTPGHLKEYVEGMVKQGKSISIFKPIKRIPGE